MTAQSKQVASLPSTSQLLSNVNMIVNASTIKVQSLRLAISHSNMEALVCDHTDAKITCRTALCITVIHYDHVPTCHTTP